MTGETTEKVLGFVRELERRYKPLEGFTAEHLGLELFQVGMIVALADPGPASEVLERLVAEGMEGPILPSNLLQILLES